MALNPKVEGSNIARAITKIMLSLKILNIITIRMNILAVLEDRRDEIGVEIETPLFVQWALNVVFLVSGLALLGGVIIVIVLSLSMSLFYWILILIL